jgi:hypothetical protein
MRTLPTLLILLFAIATGPLPLLAAQVDVELIVPQEQFLRDEPVPVKVRVTNRSGQTLRLGDTNDWLTFTVEIPGRGPVERLGQPPVTTPFDLESAHQATREVDIRPWFDLSLTERYTITATVRIRQWNQETVAKAKNFEVVRGAKLWEQEVGVPSAGQPEVRRYVLQQANYRKQLKLYLRLSNESDTVAFTVLPLGPIVSFGRPEAQIDEASNLHVLFQTGARTFFYSIISPSGTITTRQTFEYTVTRPTLRLNEVGRIIVAGGIRRLATSDLPPLAATSAVPITPVPEPNRATDAPPK